MMAIIDYDAGNIKSVEKALIFLGKDVKITREKEEILSADHVVLPGVGNFGDCMEKLNSYGLVEVIHEVVRRKIPFLGICLGYQLMFEESEEAPGVKGLGIFKGKCIKFPENKGLKVPQIGWNSLVFPHKSRIFAGLEEGSFVYFVHSFHVVAEDKNIVAARANYILDFDAACEEENVFGCQFHPEKSSEVGLNILKNFIEL